MTQPALWWQHHRMRPPVMARETRWTVARYPWGVAVWEKPLHWVAPAGMRVVDVVVTDPTAPVELAHAHAVERMPSTTTLQRVARALPFPASPRSVTAALVIVLSVVATAIFTRDAWLLLVIPPLLVVVFAAADRGLHRHHPAAWRREGHEAAAVPFTGRIQLADALCARSTHQPYADRLRHAVRHALWECRADRPGPRTGRPRLDAWLDDLDHGDRLAAEVLELTAYAEGPDRYAAPATAVDRAAELVPDLVGSLATLHAGHRADVLRQLAALRDACEEALVARDALARTVDAVDTLDGVDGGGDGRPYALTGAGGADAWVALRVEDLLGDLRAEAAVLREVDDELRARDGRGADGVHGR